MSNSIKMAFAALSCFALSACFGGPLQDPTASVVDAESADIILKNARIFTSGAEKPWAEAVAIKDGRFVFVGDDDAVADFTGEETVVSDLEGQFVMPGMIDSHAHPAMMGLINLHGFLARVSPDDFPATVKAAVENIPGEGWVRLCCWWNENYIADGKPGPNKVDLDVAVPDRPLWIISRGWHSTWMNSRALEILGVTKETKDPAPGVADFVRDENGELTGWVKEGAAWQYSSDQFAVDPEKLEGHVDAALAGLSEAGVTTVFDAGNIDYEDEVYGYISELDAAGELPVRYEGTYMVFVPERRYDAIAEMKRLQETYGGERLNFRKVKLFMDGITPELSSGMIEPFEGYPDYVPDTLLSVAELRDWLLELHDAKFDLHIHAIGDLSVRRALDAVEEAQEIVGPDFYPRVTLAHLETVDEADMPRFQELGVTATFTPQWHGRLTPDFSHGLVGDERAGHEFPANAILSEGGNVSFSSDDFGLDALSPFLGIQIGHNRRDPEEWLEGIDVAPDAFRPPESEKIALEDMLKGYTIRGAYSLRMGDELGSIEVGKIADLLVLSDDPFKVDRRTIHKIEPSVIMMEGEVTRGTL